MVKNCLVLGCPNKGIIPGVSYFNLTQRRYQKWMKILGRDPAETLSYRNVVCSDHFLNSHKIEKKTKTYLTEDAVPCLKLKLLEHHRNQIELSRKENTPPPMISPKLEFEYNELHYFDPDVERPTCTPTLEVETYPDSPPSTVPNENNKIEYLSPSSDSDLSEDSNRIMKDVKYLHNYSESVNNMDLPNNYIYYNVSDTTVRTKFQNGDEVQKWVMDLQEHTKATWSITRTIITPSLKARKNVFKRNYHCQFKTRTRKVTTPRLRAHASKNLDCPAELTIVIKRQPKQKSRAAVPDNLISDWPCVITFKDNHNHTITGEAALTKRPIGEITKQEILNLFDKGHSAASAYHTFCLKKMEELGDQYESFVADRHYFPNKSDFSNLWKANFKNRYGEKSGEPMFAQLQNNLNKSDGLLFKISHVGEHYAISLCTPIMQRAASELGQSSEILFVEAISACDVQNHKLYFFATQSPAGEIPLGCIITNSLQSETFEVAVKNLFEIFPTQILPSVILTDDEMEHNVLKKYWPHSVLLLSTFHILKAVWKWLCQIKNKIYRGDRQVMYQLFRKILISRTQKEMEESIKYFNTCIMCAKYPQYKNYVQNMIKRNIKAWCLYFRQDLMLAGSDTNIEVVFRLFKEVLLERIKAYNLIQLTDFVITSFEGYYKQRLLDLVTNKLSTIFQLFPIDGVVVPEQISELGEMQYHVRSSKDNEVKYFVDMNCNICTCPQGATGKICKHQLAIIKYYNITNACNALSPESKTILNRIATGMEPTKEILLPLKLENCNETNKVNSNEMNSSKPSTLVETLPDDNDDKSFIIETCLGDIENKWSEFIYKFDADVRKNIKDDPRGFSSAIERFISNYDRNVKDSSTLMTGLATSFRNYGSNSSTINSVTRKRKKMSIRPTFVVRRKVRMIGRRKIQARRKIQGLRKRKTTSHSLQTCAGQGENEFNK